MPELGRKITCVDCGAKFYDLAKSEAICPKCGKKQERLDETTVKRPRRPSPPVRDEEEVNDAETESLEVSASDDGEELDIEVVDDEESKDDDDEEV